MKIAFLSTFLAVQAQALVSISWVTVEDPDATSDAATGYGNVNSAYRIARYETTISQYVEFLNSAAKSDPYGLYNPSMASDLNIAGIARSGISGEYVYSVIGNGNKPVTYVSWFDAARFANWIHNGQTPGGTETGVYNLSGSTSGIHSVQPGASIWIPTEDQWYKAAYHVPATLSSFWSYPTSSSLAQSNGSAVEGVLVGNPFSGYYVVYNSYAAANFFYNDGINNSYNGGYAVTESSTYSSSQNYLTPVGNYVGSSPYGSVFIKSPHGTYDQGGNVWEWNDATAVPQDGLG
jgi:formylglycine-generating enzyme required for sulfatase activity